MGLFLIVNSTLFYNLEKKNKVEIINSADSINLLK